ncbi:MAG: bifunctional demethylmenaquinone methyltransferase/2-methoxy-6-polyprenyl-1,4-benzoquinol methylase UbiE [Desulfuromonas sp.]|nr:MAG: bifunctional demethylmenaquinone methyltransferase/2-methoxy-6-polyprenyl-1,4-benzoquinol methylase UbiE [Desulfuromonas sp.]
MFNLSEKGRGIREMFDAIAPRYDLLNRLLSLGIDRRWRTFAVRQLQLKENGKVLDIATGTGDIALEIVRQFGSKVEVVGVDFTQGMLVHGLPKIAAAGAAKQIHLVNAPCEALPLSNTLFNGVTIAFGIRNVVERQQGLNEMFRVLKPGGRVAILEFSSPTNPFFNAIYNFYFRRLLPLIGGLFSRRSAYQYLPDSVLAFPDRETFKGMMSQAGFRDLRHFDLTFGIATVYVGDRPL